MAGSGEVRSPAGRWSVAMAYDAYGKSVISRSDWDPAGAACLVSAKAAHGWETMRARGNTSSFHMDYDAGQVCVASGGEHLIVNLGLSGGYSWGERGCYYGKGNRRPQCDDDRRRHHARAGRSGARDSGG